MWISVVIASLSRRDILHETVLSLARQSRPADEILLSVVDPEQDLKAETLSSPWLKSGFDAYKDGFKTSNEYGDGQA